jgi:magnesium-transporting ATPase (P-type)
MGSGITNTGTGNDFMHHTGQMIIFEPVKLTIMIQRIQSVWLLLAAAAAFLTLKLYFYTGNVIQPGMAIKQFTALTAQSNTLLLISSVATGLLALISIFLFKDRKLQIKLVVVALVLSLLNILLFYMQTKKFVPGEGNYGISALVALAIPLLLFFALRGIMRDQKLVKSLDRLR